LPKRVPRHCRKDDLYTHLWPDTFVVDANLANLIADIRSAVGDRAHEPRIIRTVHGFGCAFVADAHAEPVEVHDGVQGRLANRRPYFGGYVAKYMYAAAMSSARR